MNQVWNAVEIRWERISSGGVVSVESERMMGEDRVINDE